MNNFWTRLVIFLIVNFGALYIGNVLQGDGPFSQWYKDLQIAPWTPPGWFFGVAWATIMFCFSIYLALLLTKTEWQKMLPIFLVQFVLNVSWNPMFFRFHQVFPALLVLLLLTVAVFLIAIKFHPLMESKSLLIAPYEIWLLVAMSLNVYVLVYN